MKLLFITRKIDKQDSLAGFIYNWVKKLSTKVDKLVVICQEKGDSSDLPDNIEIYSMGKEKRYSKFKQLYTFKLLLFKHVRRVDGVFAHMMPIYSITAGPFCKMFNKKLIQWYTHKSVDWKLKLANLYVNEFVTASKTSFRLKTKKPVSILGHGIDTDLFRKKELAIPKSEYFNLISIARISPAKDYESMVKAVYDLKQEGINNIRLDIIGGPGLRSQEEYLDALKKMVNNMELTKQVEFLGPIPNTKIPSYLNQSDLFINLSHTGSLDKAVLEPMAMETLVLTSNEAFNDILPKEFMVEQNNPKMLAEKIKDIMSWTGYKQEEWQKKLRQIIVDNHNLDKLVEKIIKLY